MLDWKLHSMKPLESCLYRKLEAENPLEKLINEYRRCKAPTELNLSGKGDRADISRLL